MSGEHKAMRRKLVVGNWKMHGSHAANAQLLGGLQAAGPWVAEVAVCPPFFDRTSRTTSAEAIPPRVSTETKVPPSLMRPS